MRPEGLRVRDFMKRDVLTVRSDTDIMRAVRLFIEHDVSGLPVLDPAGELVGMLTERDCIRTALQAGYHDEEAGTVERYMSSPVRSMLPDDGLLDVAEFFAESTMHRCPVVEDGHLVGLISRRDVLRALTEGAWFARR
ncbi:MAG: CBS domain-containing protein [Pseudomonadales bacterium]